MSKFEALPVTERLVDAVQAAPEDDNVLLHVKPPKDSDGLEESIELFKSFYTRDVEPSPIPFFQGENNSPTCSMELWYEDESIQFMFNVPDKGQEQHYRRQLAGHFPGVEIQNVWRNEDKFLDMSVGDHIVAYRMDLKHHYFEPIRSPASLADDFDHDPYQTILSGFDTKDPSIRSMVQVMYKPAEDGWTELNTNNVETYAKKLQNSGGVKTRWFGLVIDEVETPKAKDQAVKQIRQQVNKPAYYVNIRVVVVAEDKADAEAHARSIAGTYQNEYREVTKQQLVPKTWRFNRERNIHDLIMKMAKREGQFMEQPASPLKFLRHTLWNCETKIMTIPELAGLAHIPSGGGISVDGVDWTDAPVSGTLPAEAEKFSPVSEEEKSEALEYERNKQKGSSLDRFKEPDENEDESTSESTVGEGSWDDEVALDPTGEGAEEAGGGWTISDEEETEEETDDEE